MYLCVVFEVRPRERCAAHPGCQPDRRVDDGHLTALTRCGFTLGRSEFTLGRLGTISALSLPTSTIVAPVLTSCQHLVVPPFDGHTTVSRHCLVSRAVENINHAAVSYTHLTLPTTPYV